MKPWVGGVMGCMLTIRGELLNEPFPDTALLRGHCACSLHPYSDPQ